MRKSHITNKYVKNIEYSFTPSKKKTIEPKEEQIQTIKTENSN